MKLAGCCPAFKRTVNALEYADRVSLVDDGGSGTLSSMS